MGVERVRNSVKDKRYQTAVSPEAWNQNRAIHTNHDNYNNIKNPHQLTTVFYYSKRLSFPVYMLELFNMQSDCLHMFL